MALVINTNLASIDTQRYLNQTQNAVNTATQRLSSGLRINSAKDDAAGLAISQLMTAQINGMNTAVQNANNGVSLAQTAEGALQEVQNNLQRIRTLAVQSANSSNSDSDRADMNKEAQQLLSQIQTVAQQTQFNGQNIIDGSFTGAVFQIGANAGNTINVGSLGNVQLSALGPAKQYTDTVAGASATITTLTAVGAGALTINGVDVGANIGAASSASDRVNQVVDAVNNAASQTGVTASYDSTTDAITLTSTSAITVGGTDTGLLTGIDGAAGSNVTANAATDTNGLVSLDLSSIGNASFAITQIDSALQSVSDTRASLGALQNRFSSAVASLQTSSENTSSALSSVQDTDFAQETANLTRAQILQQAGTAMLGQANTAPQQVLQLLQHLAG